MRYASIRELDISNGEGVGISLFTQGCFFHCDNCFNKETWDYDGGKPWTKETENNFLRLAERPYIKRISILGGEPLSAQNLSELLSLINRIRILLPSKTIWLYTGFEWEQIFYPLEQSDMATIRQEIVKKCDVVVDGLFDNSLRDITLKFKGSSNQRVIDVKETVANNAVTIYKGAIDNVK